MARAQSNPAVLLVGLIWLLAAMAALTMSLTVEGLLVKLAAAAALSLLAAFYATLRPAPPIAQTGG